MANGEALNVAEPIDKTEQELEAEGWRLYQEIANLLPENPTDDDVTAMSHACGSMMYMLAVQADDDSREQCAKKLEEMAEGIRKGDMSIFEEEDYAR
jgi:hypothetical protein